MNDHSPQLLAILIEYDVTSEGDATALLIDPTGRIKAAIDKRVLDIWGTDLSGNLIRMKLRYKTHYLFSKFLSVLSLYLFKLTSAS